MSNNVNNKYKVYCQDPKVLDLRDKQIKQLVQNFGSEPDHSNDILFDNLSNDTEDIESDSSSSYENNDEQDSNSSFDVEKIKKEFKEDMEKNLICFTKNDFATKVEEWLAESRHEFSSHKLTVQDKNSFYQSEKMKSVTDNKIRSYCPSDDNCSDTSVDTVKYIRSNKNKKASKITMLTIKEYNFKVIENRSKSTSDMEFLDKKKKISKERIHSIDSNPQLQNFSLEFDKNNLKNQMLEEKKCRDALSFPSVETKLKSKIPVLTRTSIHGPGDIAGTKLINNSSNRTKHRLKQINKECRKKIENRNKCVLISSDSCSDSFQDENRIKRLRRKSNSLSYKTFETSELNNVNNNNNNKLKSTETTNNKKKLTNRRNQFKKKRLNNLSIIGSTLTIGDILVASNHSCTDAILISEEELTRAIGIEKAEHLLKGNKPFQYELPPLSELIFKPFMIDPLDDDEELFANILNRGYLKKRCLK